MAGETMQLTAADGHALDAYLARPDGTPSAGMVVIQEVFGVNSHIRAVTEGYAAEGYLAVAPALFDRVARGVELGYAGEDLTRGRELRAEVGWDRAMEDIAAAMATVAEAGPTGVVGYCWGGSLAYLAACRLGPAAAVGYYGGQIADFLDETPGSPLLLHFGEKDAFIEPEQVAAVRAAHPDVPVHLYPAGHGFNCTERGDYHPESARLALERSLAFFAEHLA